MRDWRAYVKSHLTGRLRDPAREPEILEELAQQLEDRYVEALSSGASEEEATSLAMAEIPEWESLAREIRRLEKPTKQPLPESGRGGLAVGLWQDLKIGLRTLVKAPGFTGVTVGTLALGIGATAAIFSIVYAVLLRPLPYPDAGRLMVLHGSHAERNDTPWSVSPPDFEDWKRETDAFEAMALTTYWSFNVIGPQAPERIVGARVTGEFFDLLGVPALWGRTLTEDDDHPGAPDTLILSYGFWQRMFGADREVLGRTLVLNG